jgi:hypothetical protein
MRPTKILLLLALSLCAATAVAFPLWLDSPSRINPHDPKSPLYVPVASGPASTATLTATMTFTYSPTQTQSFTVSPTLTCTTTQSATFSPTKTNSPTLTPSPTRTNSPTPTNTPVAGKDWVLTNGAPPFIGRFAHTSVTFTAQMWAIAGGDAGFAPLGDVWSSSDGVTWNQATAAAAFSARYQHSSVSYHGDMWVIGGYDAVAPVLNDVWSSADGATWNLVTPAAAFTPRYGQTSIVYNDLMWVIGGFDGVCSCVSLNDAWSSSDGITWTQAPPTVPFPARDSHGSVDFNGKMWVIGGNDAGAGNFPLNDVWSSTDGSTWTMETAAAAFSPRLGFGCVVYNNRMWVIGGHDWLSFTVQNDVWSSADGITWTLETSAPAFATRTFMSSMVFNSSMWTIGGFDQTFTPIADVWRSP